jgi:hypothetical protein
MFTIKSGEEFIADIRRLDPSLKNIRLSSIEIEREKNKIRYNFICDIVVSEELQDKIYKEVDFITLPADASAVASECISLLNSTGIAADHEQLVRRTDGSRITVCDIDEIVFAIVHSNDVPHMPACTRAASHNAVYQNTAYIAIKRRKVTEILECLRVTFTNYIRTRIAVKYRNKLPRIAIRSAPACSVIIIRYKAADRVLV